jgi:hypothetical protein
MLVKTKINEKLQIAQYIQNYIFVIVYLSDDAVFGHVIICEKYVVNVFHLLSKKNINIDGIVNMRTNIK